MRLRVLKVYEVEVWRSQLEGDVWGWSVDRIEPSRQVLGRGLCRGGDDREALRAAVDALALRVTGASVAELRWATAADAAARLLRRRLPQIEDEAARGILEELIGEIERLRAGGLPAHADGEEE